MNYIICFTKLYMYKSIKYKIISILGLSHLWTISDDTSDVVREEEVTTLEDPMETAMKGLVLSAENCKISNY